MPAWDHGGRKENSQKCGRHSALSGEVAKIACFRVVPIVVAFIVITYFCHHDFPYCFPWFSILVEGSPLLLFFLRFLPFFPC